MSEKSPPRTDRRRRSAKNFGDFFCRIDEKRYLCTRNGSPCGRHRRSGDEKGNGWKSRTVPAVVSSSAARRTQAQVLSTTDRRDREGAAFGASQKTCRCGACARTNLRRTGFTRREKSVQRFEQRSCRCFGVPFLAWRPFAAPRPAPSNDAERTRTIAHY